MSAGLREDLGADVVGLRVVRRDRARLVARRQGLLGLSRGGQGQSELAPRPGVPRVGGDGLTGRARVIRGRGGRLPRGDEPEQRAVVGEASRRAGDVIDRGGRPLASRERVGERRVRVEADGGQVERPPQPLDLERRVARMPGDLGRGVQPSSLGRGAARPHQKSLGPLGSTARGLHAGGVKQQCTVLRRGRNSRVEGGVGLALALEGFERTVQRLDRPGGALAQPQGPRAQPRERRLRLPSRLRCREVSPRVLLVRVLEAGSEAMQGQSLVEASLGPGDPREQQRRPRAVSPRPHRPLQEPRRARGLPGVAVQLGAERLGEDGLRVLSRARRLEPADALLAGRQGIHALQHVEFGGRIVRMDREERLGRGPQLEKIAVVGGELAARPRDDPVAGVQLGHAQAFDARPLAVERSEGALDRVEPLPERGLGQREAVHPPRVRLGNKPHSPRAGRAERLDEGVDVHLDEVGPVRVPQMERPAALVVADHRLRVPLRRGPGHHDEGQTAVEEIAPGLPRDGELAREPPVVLRPLPRAVRGGAVVANRVRDREVVGGHLPVAADGRQRRGHAGHAVLPHEGNFHDDAPRTGRGSLHAVREATEDLAARRPREGDGANDVAARIRKVRELTVAGLGHGGLGEGGELEEAAERRLGRLVELQRALQRGELQEDVAALEIAGPPPEQVERFFFAVEQHEGVRRVLEERTGAWRGRERLLRNGQRLVDAILLLEDEHAQGRVPFGVRVVRLGLCQAGSRALEVAEHRDRTRSGVQHVGARSGGGRVECACDALEKLPSSQRAPPV